jgi:spoIIIJ-associated protein
VADAAETGRQITGSEKSQSEILNEEAMKGYVEFTGKTIDEAIQEACAYFAVEREKLEIEIINDAKTGIFGLVGVKKAALRARRAQIQNVGLDFQGKDAVAVPKKSSGSASEALPGAKLEALAGAVHKALPESAPKELPGAKAPVTPAAAGEEIFKTAKNHKTPQGRPGSRPGRRGQSDNANCNRDADRVQTGKTQHQEARQGKNRELEKDTRLEPQDAEKATIPEHGRNGHLSPPHNPARGMQPVPASNPEEPALPPDEPLPAFEAELPGLPLKTIDQNLLREVVLEALEHLVPPIAGPTENDFRISEDRVWIKINCADNRGLLIGRDGQTLAALQYLLSCIASRRLNASINVQIDAGEYREKQNEKLRDLAMNLARKVKESLRPQSTRPMSAYQRRIVHMTLQDDQDVQTHSKGEGSLKRVVVVPRRKTPDQISAKDA